jgi:2-amino-4-hydroxy-6-hydroxymethyldihydropteridine diphosphokinase
LVVPERSSRVAVALGSNLGDREQTLRDAVAALGAHIRDLRVSTFHDTAPVGITEQPRFLNAAAVGVTALSPREFLDVLLDIERRFGRVRSIPNAARTLDLDLILYGDVIAHEPGLILPHPRFRTRLFVLAPLAEIAPDWRDPVSGLSVAELRTHAGSGS